MLRSRPPHSPRQHLRSLSSETFTRFEFNVDGLAARHLMRLLRDIKPSALSRQLRRLRVDGLLKRAAKTYRYYLTCTRRLVTAPFEHLTTVAMVPA